MKLVGRYIDKNNAGNVALVPEDAEDMWHTYNLIQVGDTLRATTIRKVSTETATGSTSSNKVRTMLTVSVEAIDFDTQAGAVRVKGRNVEENDYVKLGAYHTLDLEMNRKFTLGKPHWDTVCLMRLEEACDPMKRADVAAIVMQEGLAHVCLVMSSMTLVRAKIEMNIPRKRKGMCSQHDKGLTKFYDQVTQALLRHINFEVVKCLLLASPGFVKDQYFQYVFEQAEKLDQKVLLENRSKFLLVHSSSGFKHSLTEVMQEPAVTSKLQDTKALAEVKSLQDFFQMLQTDPDRAYYGFKHVQRAADAQGVETLLVTDELFRSQDIAERAKYVSLVDQVRDSGGVIRIFSSLHVSGEQLGQLSGVAAILRYPMPDLDEDQDETSGEA